MRFILLVIPIPKISNDTDYYVKELLIFVKSLIPIEIVLLDRGFYSWGVIKVLQKLKLGYIILVPKYDKFKEWLKKGARLHDHQGKLNRDKTTYKISTCIAILPDYKGFDWVFATNIKYEYGSSSRGVFRSGDLLISCSGGTSSKQRYLQLLSSSERRIFWTIKARPQTRFMRS